MNTQRTAVVTGGGSGIGLAISRRLADDGASVGIMDINGDAAETAAAKIEAGGGKAFGGHVDVTDRASIDAAVAEVRRRLGPPVILVTSAGVAPDGPFVDTPADTWEQALAVNLTGTFHCCQATLPSMLEAGWGRIVTISSSSVHSGVPGMSSYVAAKSGVVGLTKCLALELGASGITVNSIPPGFIDTPMLRGAEQTGLISIEEQVGATPVGRPGRPEDIAAACAFLVSDEASYVTGQIIGVNGGRNT